MTSAEHVPAQNPKSFISHLHAFRGVAILTIVGAHCWSGLILFSGGVEKNPPLGWVYSITETLFHGSTLYFALISGLLFSLILRPKGFTAFFKSKLLNVMLPYAVVSVAFTAITWQFYLANTPEDQLDTRFLVVTATNILTGKAFFHLWYIPVLAGLFVATPAVEWCLKQAKTQWFVLVLAALPLVISRTEYPDLISWQTIVFFLGAYASGMFLGNNYSKAQLWIGRHVAIFWVTLIASTGLLFYCFIEQIKPEGLINFKQTTVYIQKMAAAALFLYYLAKREDRPSGLLSSLGSYAFSIYFLHGIISTIFVMSIVEGEFAEFSVLNVTVLGFGVYVFSIALSVLIAALIKKIAGRHSRKIIGA